MRRASRSPRGRTALAAGLTGLWAVGVLAGGGVSPAAAGDIGVNDFRISQFGAALDATHPSVAYNPAADEYLVVWEGEKADGEFEIYGG